MKPQRLGLPCSRCHARALVIEPGGYTTCTSCGKTTRPKVERGKRDPPRERAGGERQLGLEERPPG